MMGRKVPAPLPNWEQLTYYVIFICSSAYCFYNLYLSSRDLRKELKLVRNTGSWLSTFSGGEDIADGFWYTYLNYYMWAIYPPMLVYIVLSRGLQYFNPSVKLRKYGYILLGVLLTLYLQSWQFLLLLLLVPLPFYVVSNLTSVPAVWVVFLPMMYFQSDIYKIIEFKDFLQYFISARMTDFVPMRCLFFALERIWAIKQERFANLKRRTVQRIEEIAEQPIPPGKSTLTERRRTTAEESNVEKTDMTEMAHFTSAKTSFDVISEASAPSETRKCLYDWPVLPEVPGLLEFYLYVMYPPWLVACPQMTFKTFIEQFENPVPLSSERLLGILWKLLRVCFWSFFNYITKHFFYFAAIGKQKELFETVGKWTLVGTGWLIGQFRTNKYFVIYGSIAEVAKFDGLDFPQHPACISTIYLYSDMWRSFDRGLHTCLTRYLFIPMGGRKSGFWRMQAAVLSCFILIGFFHGDRISILWGLINFVEVSLETLGTYLERTEPINTNMRKLSPAWDRRLRGLMSYPLFVIGTASCMMLYASSAFAYYYVTRIYFEWDSLLTTAVIMYSAFQVVKHLEILGRTKYS